MGWTYPCASRPARNGPLFVRRSIFSDPAKKDRYTVYEVAQVCRIRSRQEPVFLAPVIGFGSSAVSINDFPLGIPLRKCNSLARYDLLGFRVERTKTTLVDATKGCRRATRSYSSTNISANRIRNSCPNTSTKRLN